MNKTTTTILYVTLGLGGAVGLFFITKGLVKGVQKRNEEKAKAKLQAELDNETGNNEVEEVNAQQYSPANDLKTFEDYVLGYNYFPKHKEVEGLFNKLTDAKLKKLNTAFQNKHNKSLWKHLDDEWDDIFFGNWYKTPMNRLSGLGLR